MQFCEVNLFNHLQHMSHSVQPWDEVGAFIIDMDGVLWHGQRPQEGLVAFFNCLRQRALPFVLATNNASQTPQQYVDKLAGMGVSVDSGSILTSGQATASYLAQRFPAEKTKVYVIGMQGLTEPLRAEGFTLLTTEAAEQGAVADLVVCGLDRQLTYAKLTAAATFLARGAQFVASNGDTTLPLENGVAVGNGAVIAALKAATGIEPLIIGKPEPIMYNQAMQLLSVEPQKTVAIGDRLDTDILGAVKAGMRSILVLSGISGLDDLNAVDFAPTWIMRDIGELTQVLARAVER